MHLKDMGLLVGTVWSKNDLINLLNNSTRDIADTIISLPGMYGQSGGYIEVQLWDDTYIKELLK